MNVKQISPDHVDIISLPFLRLNATLVYTWIVMALLIGGSWLVTRRLSTGPKISRWQNLLEIIVQGIRDQIGAISSQNADRYLPFIGTLFLLILVPNLLGLLPDLLFINPMGSLSTTTALALCVFFAVPLFGIRSEGFLNYLKNYLRPTPFMLPFNILGELSRTLALAVRLFGNIMSGTKIIAILLIIAPLFVPVPIYLLSLLTGIIQAYIFAVLAMVYIASATQAHETSSSSSLPEKEKGSLYG